MRIARDVQGVTILAPAKLNLFLEILAKRPDGYHAIETLMVAIDLCDTLRMTSRADERIEFSARWSPDGRPSLRESSVPSQSESGNAATFAERRATIRRPQHFGDLPLGSENIVVRAIEKVRCRAKITRGANLELIKRIPSAAGLGGASSDAAAAIVAANRVWNLNWPQARLAEVAAELGSDIPFFLGPPTAVCRGRGEIIEPLDALPPLDVVLVKPPVGLSTPAVYKACRPTDQPARVEPLIAAWRRGDFAGVGRAMTNRLEPAAEKLSPWIARLRDAFARQECYAYQMSGSGSSYFGLCKSALHARRVAARLAASGLGFVVATRTMTSVISSSGGLHAA